MRSDWSKIPLSDVANLTVGFVGTMASEYIDEGVTFIRSLNVHPFKIDFNNVKYISEDFHKKLSKSALYPDDVVIVRTGQPGASAVVPNNCGPLNCSDLVIIHPEKNKIDPLFLAAYINWSSGLVNANLVGAVQQHFNVGSAKKMILNLPNLETQKKISTILGAIIGKIELNNQINENLEEQAQAIYREYFVDEPDAISAVCRADEFFNISIGKTPPRKEPQWFAHDPDEVTWVSIADMGKSSLYISESSEQLTKDAVSKFNVKVVPDNTVLLSFKLTVGRVAITDGDMATNEAIAHFVTLKPEINEYLYCYLKDFNYQTMGSTSSIATAVNSKIIKAMPFQVPNESILEQFHAIAGPMFSKIKANQAENKRLADIRDSLLPKLMSGELDVSEIDL